MSLHAFKIDVPFVVLSEGLLQVTQFFVAVGEAQDFEFLGNSVAWAGTEIPSSLPPQPSSFLPVFSG